MTEKQDKPKKFDIFSLNETPVTLTYSELGAPPITFFLRPCLTQEEQEIRQQHFALQDKDRERAQHAHNVELLARLSTREPEGLPELAVDLRIFFLGEKPLNPMKVKVAADAMTRYYRVTQPAEFFRGV